MQPLDIKASSKLFKVARSTIYAKMDKGELSRRPDGKLDFVELMRVFGEPSDRATRQEKTERVSELVQTLHTTQSDTARLAEREAELEKAIEELKAENARKDELLREAKDREKWLQEQFGKLTDTMKLLEAPKPKEEEKKGFWKRLLR